MALNLFMTLATACFGLVAMVAGIFGMNLDPLPISSTQAISHSCCLPPHICLLSACRRNVCKLLAPSSRMWSCKFTWHCRAGSLLDRDCVQPVPRPVSGACSDLPGLESSASFHPKAAICPASWGTPFPDGPHLARLCCSSTVTFWLHDRQ